MEKLCHRVAIIKEGKIIHEDDISHLKNTQLSRVNLHLTDSEALVKLDTPGIIEKQEIVDGLTFLFKGDTRSLLRELSLLPIGRISIEEPDLEEVFMHYYEDKNGEGWS